MGSFPSFFLSSFDNMGHDNWNFMALTIDCRSNFPHSNMFYYISNKLQSFCIFFCAVSYGLSFVLFLEAYFIFMYNAKVV